MSLMMFSYLSVWIDSVVIVPDITHVEYIVHKVCYNTQTFKSDS